MPLISTPPRPASDRPLWLAYAGLCLLCWALYVMAGTEWQRGAWHVLATRRHVCSFMFAVVTASSPVKVNVQ